jgi:hypothetical protein
MTIPLQLVNVISFFISLNNKQITLFWRYFSDIISISVLICHLMKETKKPSLRKNLDFYNFNKVGSQFLLNRVFFSKSGHPQLFISPLSLVNHNSSFGPQQSLGLKREEKNGGERGRQIEGMKRGRGGTTGVRMGSNLKYHTSHITHRNQKVLGHI